MDIVNQENIKIPNSIIISGITDTSFDEDLIDFLNKYGRILRTIKISDPHSPHHNNAIVEFESGAALNALEPLLPYTHESHNVKYHIRALSTEYMETVTSSATFSFFSELQKIAKLTGQSFETVLQEHLSKCSKTITCDTDQTESGDSTKEMQSYNNTTLASGNEKSTESNLSTNQTEHVQQMQQPQASYIPQSFITHPEVQKVVVEHIVRSESSVSQTSASFRLRQFSGKLPCPSHEVDFETWRNSVELVLQDPDLSDLQRSRKIVDSLAPPAANVIKPLGPKALPSAYIELLNSAFGTVEDGDELFAKFLNTLQDSGEKPSQYLHRLHTALIKAQKRGGISGSEVDRHLLRQFCRGCWNNALLADLQLERKKDNPPPFADLLLQLRVEEDKHIAKESRMKKHLATARPKVSLHVLTANTDSEPGLNNDFTEMQAQITELHSQLTKMKKKKAEQPVNPPNNIVTELRAQITELQSHLAKLTTPSSHKKKAETPKVNTKSNPKPKVTEQMLSAAPVAKSRPKPWYCFQCSEDGHIVSACSNDPNPTLVAEKRQQLKNKQLQWDKQNNQNQPLN